METPCVICETADIAHKQGDSVMLVFRVLQHNGLPFDSFPTFDFTVVLFGPRAIFRKYEYKDGNWGADNDLCDLDTEGYVAIRLQPETTEEMEGRYAAQFVVSDGETSVQSPIVHAAEIVPSVIHKIA